MEQLNSVILRGYIGSIKVSSASGKDLARFTIATNTLFSRNDGNIIETQWSNIVAWKNDSMDDFTKLHAGSAVEVQGRLHTSRYTGADGEMRFITEIYANKIHLLSEPLKIESGV